MALTDKQLNKIISSVNKAIRKGGSMPTRILDMILVLDCTLERDYLTDTAREIITALRRQGKPFLNLRINVIKWKSGDIIERSTSSFPEVQMGVILDGLDYPAPAKEEEPSDEAAEVTEDEAPEVAAAEPEPLSIDTLAVALKNNRSKSRLVLILTKEGNICKDEEATSLILDDLLCRQMVTVYPTGKTMYPFKYKSEPVEEVEEIPAEELAPDFE